MKNILITGLLLCLVATACRKQDDGSLFGQKPEERINQTLSGYKAQLTGSGNGWKAYLYPDNGKGAGYGFYFKFTDNNRVAMLGDFTTNSGSTLNESSYRLQAVQRPSLFFDTYNYLHMLADPNGAVNGGDNGVGLSSDFEFGFDSTHADTLLLTGNVSKSQLILIKASKADEDAYKAGQLNTIQTQLETYLSKVGSLSLKTPDGKNIQIIINRTGRITTMVYEDSSKIKMTTYPFAYGLNSLFLNKPATYNALNFQEIYWDSTKLQLYVQQKGTRTNLESSVKPVFSLSQLIGVTYKGFTMSDAVSAAFSTSFNADYTKAKAGVVAFPYSLYLKRTEVSFDVNAERLLVNYIMARGASEFPSPFYFSYVKKADGTYRFLAEDVTDGNSLLIKPVVAPINTRIGTDKFRLDFFTSPATGLLGQLISIDNPQYYMGGSLN